MSKESIKISGMSCAACSARIEKGLKQMAGVQSANVNLAMEKATIEYDGSLVQPEQFEQLIKKLGYEPVMEKADDQGQADLKITGMSCAACSARIEKNCLVLRV